MHQKSSFVLIFVVKLSVNPFCQSKNVVRMKILAVYFYLHSIYLIGVYIQAMDNPMVVIWFIFRCKINWEIEHQMMAFRISNHPQQLHWPTRTWLGWIVCVSWLGNCRAHCQYNSFFALIVRQNVIDRKKSWGISKRFNKCYPQRRFLFNPLSHCKLLLKLIPAMKSLLVMSWHQIWAHFLNFAAKKFIGRVVVLGCSFD